MAQVLVDRRDIDFVIWEQMNNEEIIKNGDYTDKLIVIREFCNSWEI